MLPAHPGLAPPLVSVVIPSYNRSSLLMQTLASVRGQTFRDFEVLVVDDGSTDDTATRVRELGAEDGRIHYLYQANQGPAAARNAGASYARGAFIAFLDSDDLWLPDKLQEQLAFLAGRPDIDVVYADYAVIGDVGKVLPAIIEEAKKAKAG